MTKSVKYNQFLNWLRQFIMFNIFHMRFIKDWEGCFGVRILGMTFSYYKDTVPVLMKDRPEFTEVGFREFGDSIRELKVRCPSIKKE